jgi:hypothetical protein
MKIGGKTGDKASSPRQEAAEALAITALSYLANEPEQLGRFLAASGIGPEQIRGAAREPGFLAGVLGHFVSDEKLLLAFAVDQKIDPAEIQRARAALGGFWERDTP